MLAAIAFVAASTSPLHAQPAPRDPRAVAAVRLLELEGPEVTSSFVHLIDAMRDEAALPALFASAMRDEDDRLTLVAMRSIERWPARADLALPFVMKVAAKNAERIVSLDFTYEKAYVCDAFRALRDVADQHTLKLMGTLERPRSAAGAEWLACAGAWSAAEVDQLPQTQPPQVAAPLRLSPRAEPSPGSPLRAQPRKPSAPRCVG